MNERRIAYLVSMYPKSTHTFVMREIQALRREGFSIDTFSVRTPPQDEILSDNDRKEHACTWYLQPVQWMHFIISHLVVMCTRPLRYTATLLYALRCRPRGMKFLLWHLFYFAESVYLWRELRARGHKHLHVHFGMACATLALIAGRLGDLSYSMTVHGSTVFFQVDKYLLRAKVADASFVFCISEFCRSQLMAHSDPEHWSKLHVVHCGVFESDYHVAPRRRPRGKVEHILTVGRLDAAKGVSLLLHALNSLLPEFTYLRCTIVGAGPDRARLDALTEEFHLTAAVEFVGAVGQDRMAQYYENADVFVLASFAEGVPVVLMEAMAKGVPCVATRVGGISELIEDGRTGLLVPPGNVDSLANAIRSLIENDDLHAALAAAGRATVLEQFEMARIGGHAAALFAEHLKP